MAESLEASKARWMKAAHAVQSGVAPDMSQGAVSHEPKHLRTGLNMVMSDLAGLAELLIRKGVITLEEYQSALADQAEREQANYEAELSAKVGRPIKLG